MILILRVAFTSGIVRQISFRVAPGTLVNGTAACRIQFLPSAF
ncbi:MAG: hypothetical protein ACKO50_02155 [Cyanobium sp.]